MKYEKPEVVNLGEAISTVQNGQYVKGGSVLGDASQPFNHTITAYEADE